MVNQAEIVMNDVEFIDREVQDLLDFIEFLSVSSEEENTRIRDRYILYITYIYIFIFLPSSLFY